MSRAKTQRPKPRAGPPADKPRARSVVSSVTSEAFDRLDDAAIDDALAGLELELELPPEPVRRHQPLPVRAVTIGELVADDLVLAVEDLPEIRPLAIAVHDGAPHVATARSSIAAAGHTVAVGATGRDGLELVKQALRNGTVHALLVGIPGGESLIETALAVTPRRPVVIASCAGSASAAVRRAVAAGADLVTVRPHDAERLAPMLLAASRLWDSKLDQRRAGSSSAGESHVADEDAANHPRLEALGEPEPGTLQPPELFQRVVELELKRARRYLYPIAIALFSVDVEPPAPGEAPPPGILGILRARAGNALIQSIRDIDMATVAEHDRFLVLLPYTDARGAAEVARRIIAAITEGAPLTAAGRSFPPRVVGAVAGASPGQPLAFSRLMRDATHALEEARRDGAELADPVESPEEA